MNYWGYSIEQERDGTYSNYQPGNPYATTGGFKTIEEAKQHIDKITGLARKFGREAA